MILTQEDRSKSLFADAEAGADIVSAIAAEDTRSPVERIPADVWDQIARYAPKYDLISTSCANKYLRSALSGIIFREIKLSPSKATLLITTVSYGVSGPQDLDILGLYPVVKSIVLTEFIRPAVYSSLELNFDRFTSLESLEVQSKAPMSAELYKKIRDHPTLRDLDIHLDGDTLLYRKPFLPHEMGSPKCRLCSLRAPGRIIYDLLQPGSETRRSLSRLHLTSVRQISIMNQMLPSGGTSEMKYGPLESLEELRLDLGSWSPAGKSVLDILARIPSLRSVEFMPTVHPYFTGSPPEEEIQILPELRLLTGPTNAISFILPYISSNYLRVCINDSDFADWLETRIGSSYMIRLFASGVGCRHVQELYIYTVEVYHNTLVKALLAITPDGLPSLQKLVIERDVPLRRQDGDFAHQLDTILGALVHKLPADCRVYLSFSCIRVTAEVIAGHVPTTESLEALKRAVQKRRAIFIPYVVAWAKRSADLRLQSVMIGDWDVSWFAFECVEVGSAWRVVLSPNNDLCFRRFLETYPDEEIKMLDLQTAIYEVMGDASDDEELPSDEEDDDDDDDDLVVNNE